MAKIVNPYIVLVKGEEPIPPTEGKYLVQVIDYDGTVLKTAKLNTGDTFTLPDAPTGRPRLTFQEWSSPVAITNNTITVGDSDITIGATYTTTSGLTEFDITLTEVTGLTVTCNMAGNKNWGDGTSDATTSHTYSATGNYMITCDGTTIPEYVMGHSYNVADYTLIRARISNNVTSFGRVAFSNCGSLTSITIPNSVTRFGSAVFADCHCLTSVTIPNSVTSIITSNYACQLVDKCYSLKNIVISKNVTNLYTYPFRNCTALTSITIPNSVTNIEISTFDGCHALTSITIPNSVTSIGNYAFQYCYSLTSITIPNSVTKIGYAFPDCYSLIKYDFSTFTSVPTLNSRNLFNGINGLCKILIPSALIDTWKTATNWSIYAKYMVAV